MTGDDRGVLQAGGPLGGREWVVPRSECQYRWVDLSAIPPRQRAAAARLAVARHRPSTDAVAHVAWRGGKAHLWFWASPLATVSRGEERWLPETLLAAPLATDGARLLRQHDGVEGQIWRNGELVASQSWPDVPVREAWHRFLRGGGLDPGVDPEPPALVALPWLSEPWAKSRGAITASAADERHLWLATFVLLALALGWQLAGLVRWTVASSSLADHLELTRAKAAPLLTARERAEGLQADTERLLQLAGTTSDYQLMGEIAAMLPAGSRLGAWQRESEKLQVLVQSGESDPRKFVAAFERTPRLAEVSAAPVLTGGMQLTFTLPGKARDEAAE